MITSGIDALVRMLADFGVRYLFGNPGTTELPLSDTLAAEPRLKYVLGLQEVPVMAMADGYAMASGSLGVVNLHASCGLGNAMGMLYNAHREGTPLLVTAGQQDRRLKFEEPILWGDLVSVVRPWTRYAAEVERVEDLPSAVRRAVQAALTPPTGPTFLALPLDVQLAVADLDLTRPSLIERRVRPPRNALERAAALLAGAKSPAILAGSRLTEAKATKELATLAELLGAPVYGEPGHTHGRLAMRSDHPLYGQILPHWSPEVFEVLKPFDVLFVAGMDLLRQYLYFEPARPIPEHIQLIHLDEDARQIGKNYPVAVGLWGDSKTGLAGLCEMVGRSMTDSQRAAARARTSDWSARHKGAREALRASIDRDGARRPMTGRTLMATLADSLPDNVAVVEEAVTTTNAQLERLGALRNTSGYFGHRGWALGWGLGCAIGVKLAWPERPVVAVLGEGAAMYGIQGLWSAAHYNLPVTFVIANNGQYQILKAGARALGLPAATAEKFVGMDLASPTIDLVALATSLGVEARRVGEPDELRAALAESLASNRPQLIDVPIEATLAGPGV